MEKNFKPVWEHHSLITLPDFNDALGGPAARISVLPLQYPKYSVQIGYMRSQIFNPFIPPGEDIENVKYVTEVAMGTSAELTAKVRAEEDAARAAWEKDIADAEARKKAKKARHEQNLQRRREEDRQRTTMSKNGGRK